MISAWSQENQLVLGQLAEGMRTDCQGVRHESIEDVDGGHGRVERRRLWTTDDIAWYGDVSQWKGLSRFICIESTRQVGDKRSVDRRYYISSLRQATPEFLLRTLRGHWGIENRLHWCLDVSFNEDDSRIRKGHAAENFSRLRRIALNLLRKDKTYNVGIKTKTKACSWDHQHPLNILTQ